MAQVRVSVATCPEGEAYLSNKYLAVKVTGAFGWTFEFTVRTAHVESGGFVSVVHCLVIFVFLRCASQRALGCQRALVMPTAFGAPMWRRFQLVHKADAQCVLLKTAPWRLELSMGTLLCNKLYIHAGPPHVRLLPVPEVQCRGVRARQLVRAVCHP